MRRGLGRAAGLVAVATAVGIGGARPAAADPPRPTDYRSRITAVDPAPAGVDIDVVGGDAFLELTVDEGHEVTVEGYGGEPYLRVGPDGTVERNVNSPATYLNDDRMGDVSIPASATPQADPAWERVATGGTYAWHDHNIHWMSSATPPGREPGDVVQEWEVRIDVDGVPTTVAGELTWVPGVSPLPWAALGLVAAGAVVLVGRRRRAGGGGLTGPVAALVAAGMALVVGWAQVADAPAGAGVSPLIVVVPAVGLAGGVAGLALRRRAPAIAAAGTLAAVAAVVGWGLLRLAVLWKPVLPTTLPANADRAGTALALGVAAAAAATVVLGGGMALLPAGGPARNGDDDTTRDAKDADAIEDVDAG